MQNAEVSIFEEDEISYFSSKMDEGKVKLFKKSSTWNMFLNLKLSINYYSYYIKETNYDKINIGEELTLQSKKEILSGKK